MKSVSKYYTYTFELTSPENKVVTPYSDRSLWLLSIRNMTNLEELPLDYVNLISVGFGVKCPKSYCYTQLDDLKNEMKNMKAVD